MNPYERLTQERKIIHTLMKDVKDNQFISLKEHYNKMLTLINALENDIEDAEYIFVGETIEEQEVILGDEERVKLKDISDSICALQLSPGDEAEIYHEMNDISQTLKHMTDTGDIDKNIIILHPNINILKLKLAKSYSMMDTEGIWER